MLHLTTGIESDDASTSLAAEAIDFPALALGRAAAAGLSYGDARLSLDHRRGRAVVDHAFRCHRRPDPLRNDGHDLERARPSNERVDAIAYLHLRRRFGRPTVHPNVPPAAGGRRLRTALVDPDRPEPDVYPGRFDQSIVPVR